MLKNVADLWPHKLEEMDRDRFAYFLNAVCYFIWRGELVVEKINFRIILWVMSIIAYCVLWGSWHDKFRRRLEYVNKDFEIRRKYPEHYQCDHMCADIFTVGYCFPIVFVFFGLWLRAGLGGYYVVPMLLIVAVSLWGWFFSFGLLETDCYKKYFKKFAKKDAKWHRKWRLITWAYCFGGAVLFVGGIITALAIAVGGYGNLDFPFLHR